MIRKAEIAKRAAELVGGDRDNTHGDAYANHAKIADVWNGILAAANMRVQLTPHDVANMMEGLKIARRYLGAFNIDDYVDGAGYAAVAGEVQARQIEIDKSWSDAALNERPDVAPRAKCCRPSLTADFVCECHRRLGNEFWHLPMGHCLLEVEPK